MIITKTQFLELKEAFEHDKPKFRELLLKYTGITAHPETTYYYTYPSGDYLGELEEDSHSIHEFLANAWVTVEKETPTDDMSQV